MNAAETKEMDGLLIGLLVFLFLFLAAVTVGAIVGVYYYQKHLQDVTKKLHLVRGRRYDVMTNNGITYRGLMYSHTAYGRNSINGKVNIYFVRETMFRGTLVNKQIMIKFGNIWKLYDLTNEFNVAQQAAAPYIETASDGTTDNPPPPPTLE